MRKVETQLITSDNQFGFKREHGTDLCMFTVKSVIKYYNLHDSPVYISKNYVLGGELKCRHILLFLMEYDKDEYVLYRICCIYG